jgi:hypothetical protein
MFRNSSDKVVLLEIRGGPIICNGKSFERLESAASL